MSKIKVLDDKLAERDRYDERAKKYLVGQSVELPFSVETIPLSLRSPYLYYEHVLYSYISDSRQQVLEIGSGTGNHTGTLLASGGNVTATDISKHSLDLLKKRYKDPGNLVTRVADMESLPFENSQFDVVCSAGSLSYGDTGQVLSEIHRVLKKKRCFCLRRLSKS